MTVPQDALLTVLDRQTTELLDYALAELWAADFNAESRLDGWTAGYVATYIAREADRMADHLLVSTARAVPPTTPIADGTSNEAACAQEQCSSMISTSPPHDSRRRSEA